MNSRDAALIAEKAWNATKDSTDPDYLQCQPDHQLNLASLVNVIESQPTGAQVPGLEAFEAKVNLLLAAPAPKLLATVSSPKPVKEPKKAKEK